MNPNINPQGVKNPFKHFCMSIGAIPTSYKETLSYYETLLYLIRFLEDRVIPAVDNNAKALEELQDLFIQLKNYVDNYFDNLDVQEEINNKLDSMVESGEFQELLDDYLSYIKETYIIEEIEYITGKIDDTEYFIAHVPHLDNDGNPIVLKHGFANDNNTATASAEETPKDFALRNYASFCCNASIFGIDDSEENYHHAIGTIIKDGQLISNYDNAGYTTTTQNRMRLLGVKSDGSLSTYPFNTAYDTMIEDGVVNSFAGYGTVIENGVFVYSGDDTDNINNFIFQNTDTKDLYFITCNGRDIDKQSGLKPSEIANLMITEYNCDYGFYLDGGGSACFVKNGVMMNTPYDDYGTTIRKVPDYIYFSKEPTNNIDINTNMILKFISDTEEKLNETFNRLYYLQNIYNNRLNFNFPNVRTTTESGMRLRYTKDAVLKSSLIFDTNEQPLVFSIYDNINNKTVAKIDGTNEEIVVNSKIVGAFFRTGYNVTNANDAVNSGIYRLPGNASNSPYPTGVGAMLLVLKGESGGVRQIAMAQTTDSTTRAWYTRNSNSDISSWESWKVILTPTNE